MCSTIRASFKKLAVFLMIIVLFAGGVSLVRAGDDSSKSSKAKPKTSAEAKKSGEKKSGEKKSSEKKDSGKKDDSGSKKSGGGMRVGSRRKSSPN